MKFYLTMLCVAIFAMSCNKSKNGEGQMMSFDKPTIMVQLPKSSPKEGARFGFTDGDKGVQGVKVKWDKDDVLLGWNADGTRAIFKLISGAGSYSAVFQIEGDKDAIKGKELNLFAMTRSLAETYMQSGAEKPATAIASGNTYKQGKSGAWNGETQNSVILTTINGVDMQLASKSVLTTETKVTYDGTNTNLTDSKNVMFTMDYAVMILVLDGNLAKNPSFIEGGSTLSAIKLTLDGANKYECTIELATHLTLSGPDSNDETTDAVVYIPVPHNPGNQAGYTHLGITMYRDGQDNISVTKESKKNVYEAGKFYHRILLNGEDPIMPPSKGWTLIENDWFIPSGGTGSWN